MLVCMHTSVAAFALLMHTRTVVTEAMWHVKPQTFTLCPFNRKIVLTPDLSDLDPFKDMVMADTIISKDGERHQERHVMM